MSVTTWHFIVALLAGWVNREQHKVIEYLKLEREILREQMGPRRLRFTDRQRRRLAAAGRMLGRSKLRELGSIDLPPGSVQGRC